MPNDALPRASPEATSRERSIGIALVLFAAVTWSLAGLGIKVLWASALSVAGFRSLFALPVVTMFLGARIAWRKEPVRAALARPLVWGATVAYASTVVIFVAATKLTTAANAILLQYTAPIWVALLSYPILRERLRRIDVVATVMCFCGIGWVFRERVSARGTVGDLLALISGVGFALLPLLLRRADRGGEAGRADGLVAIALGNALTALCCLPWMIASPPPDARAWIIVVALGMGQLGMSYVAYTAGVARVRAVEAVLVATIEPILNPIWVALGIGELPGSATLVGGAVIVASVALQGIVAARGGGMDRA